MIGRVLRFVGKALLWFLLMTVGCVILYRFVPPPVTLLMTKRLYEQFRDDRPLKLKKHWKPIHEISPHLPSAVIAAEDQLFLSHKGFDWEAIQRAYRQRSEARRVGKQGRGRRAAGE